MDCVSESLCKSFAGGPIWQLSACGVIAFIKFKYLLQAENGMTGRACMGEVLKSIKN